MSDVRTSRRFEGRWGLFPDQFLSGTYWSGGDFRRQARFDLASMTWLELAACVPSSNRPLVASILNHPRLKCKDARRRKQCRMLWSAIEQNAAASLVEQVAWQAFPKLRSGIRRAECRSKPWEVWDMIGTMSYNVATALPLNSAKQNLSRLALCYHIRPGLGWVKTSQLWPEPVCKKGQLLASQRWSLTTFLLDLASLRLANIKLY